MHCYLSLAGTFDTPHIEFIFFLGNIVNCEVAFAAISGARGEPKEHVPIGLCRFMRRSRISARKFRARPLDSAALLYHRTFLRGPFRLNGTKYRYVDHP